MEGFQNYSQVDFKKQEYHFKKMKQLTCLKYKGGLTFIVQCSRLHASNDVYDFPFSTYFGFSLLFFFSIFLRCKFNLVIWYLSFNIDIYSWKAMLRGQPMMSWRLFLNTLSIRPHVRWGMSAIFQRHLSGIVSN